MRIRTLFVVPHAHTDIGYTHDPAICWELQLRFVDRALDLCARTADYPEGAAFRWTIEVFAVLDRWWRCRDDRQRERLVAAMRAGQIDVGARYLNGTCLSDAGDIRWELDRAQAWSEATGIRLRHAVQNDVNGFALAYAQAMHARGIEALAMGLNTTMGISPRPRPTAWRWRLPGGGEILTWHGWIYNRLKSFISLPDLAAQLPARWDDFHAALPADYPWDFAMTSGTVNDNVGPLAYLPDQVRAFNAAADGRRIRLVTIGEFFELLRAHAADLPVMEGDWPDAWNFGHAAMPAETAAARRAQRHLGAVEAIRARGWAQVDGGSLTLDRGREHLALAAEHTYGSHAASVTPLWPDTQRQHAQVMIDHWLADSIGMGLLCDHRAAIAAGHAADRPGVLAINPWDQPLPVRCVAQVAGLRQYAREQASEHLMQLDREPTWRVLAERGDLVASDPAVPPRSIRFLPFAPLATPRREEALDMDTPAELADGHLRLTVDPRRGAVSLRDSADREWLAPETFLLGRAWHERPLGERGFQTGHGELVRDPSDQAWRRDLVFERSLLPAPGAATRIHDVAGEAIRLEFTAGPLLTVTLRLDPLLPGVLAVDSEWRLAADTALQALYLPFAFKLPGDGDVTCHYHACDRWLRAGADQIPGSARSFHEGGFGAAVSRGGAGVLAVAADTPLWQFGGFTFGPPELAPDCSRAVLNSWLFNNYWFCNYPASAPGGARAAYLIMPFAGDLPADRAEQLYHTFAAPRLAHPIWPDTPEQQP